MANSSFYKNVGTSTQLQGSASASAAAALASEQAALASKNAAAVSETNSAASAASALVHSNAAASSVSSINANAISTAADVITTAGHAATTTADATTSTNAAAAAAADVVLTNADVVSTNADVVQTAADRVQTGLDVTSTGASAAAALSSRNAAATSETNAAASAASSSSDATATAADRVQTGLDRAATNADAIATAADRVQTGLDATASANSASAASTSATAAAASQVSAASSAASAAAVFNDFEDRYYGPHATDAAAQTHVTGLGLTVDQGDLYFNSTANEMRVYDGGSFIAASSAGGASLINYNYTATASQTAFSGSDDNSNTLSYTVDNLIVTRNGVVLEDGTDYTATDGSTITLTVAAAAGDEINIVAFKSFTTADMVSATNGGTFQSNVAVNGTMTATAFSGDGSALTGITIPTLSSLGIANHDQVTVTAGGAVTATSFSGNGANLTNLPVSTPTLTSLGIANHDDITVDSSGNVGIGTSSPTKKVSASIGLSDTDGYVLEYSGEAKAGLLVAPTTGEVRMGAINSSGTYFTTFYSNNSEAMRIDSLGRVTIPYQPFALVDFGGSGYVSVSAGIVAFNNIVQNQGNHYNTSTYKFTCPVAGVYRVSAKFITAGNVDLGHINLYKNNVRVFKSYTVYRGWSGDFTIHCSANDILHLDTDSASVWQATGIDRYSWGSYYLLG